MLVFAVTEFADTFDLAEFVLAEAFVVAAAILAVGLAFASTMRPHAPRVKLLLALLMAALLSKTLANAVQFGPERALAWLTPGVYGGLASRRCSRYWLRAPVRVSGPRALQCWR